MAITSADLLSWAERCAADGDEVSRRAAASRAYYAAFHACAEIANRIPEIAVNKGGVHARIVRKLVLFSGQQVDLQKRVRTLGHDLSKAKDSRTRADYHIGGEFTPRDVSMTLKVATQVVANALVLASEI
jgi:uncharacterized protein (UPF0332 family)